MIQVADSSLNKSDKLAHKRKNPVLANKVVCYKELVDKMLHAKRIQKLYKKTTVCLHVRNTMHTIN